MRFRLIEENELERRAKYHRKRQNGMSPFYSPDGGNVPLAISRFNDSVADGANGLCENVDDMDESIAHTQAVEMALRGIYGRRISDALDDYLSRFPYAEVFDSRQERNKFIDWAKKNRYIESLEEDVIPNKEINYIGFFVDTKDINRILKSIGARSLEKRIPVPHVTTKYKPQEIDTSLFGKTIDIVINGYGKNDTNEGFRVELRTNDHDLQNQIDNIAKEGSIPHITTSISADGKAVNTRYLDFKDIRPITIKGTFGGFTKNKGVITKLNESLLTEYGGGGSYRVSRYIHNFSNGVSNGINGLLGLERTDPHKKRNERRYGYKKSVRNGRGNNQNKSKVAPENRNRRYYGDLSRKTVVKFNEGDFDDMCRENNVLLRDKRMYKEIRKTACDRNGIDIKELVTKMQESNPKITDDYALYIIDEYIEDAR